jgi:hypothetical protein
MPLAPRTLAAYTQGGQIKKYDNSLTKQVASQTQTKTHYKRQGIGKAISTTPPTINNKT